MKKLIKFSKQSCTPCKMVENYLQDKEVQYTDVDVFDRVDLATQYGIVGVPVLVLEEDGVIIDKVVGFNPDDIDNLLNQL